MESRASSGGWRRVLPAVLVAAALCAGCDQENEPVYFGAGAKAEWSKSPASVDRMGYTIAVAVLQMRRGDDTCVALPSSTRVLINGQETALAAKDETGCMEGGQILGPLLHDQSVTVMVEQSGQATATATFNNLLPGTAATMSGPSELHAGDDIVIRPVPDIPDAQMGLASFYLLDDPIWRSTGALGDVQRQRDGLHVKVPAFTGRAVFTVWNTHCDIGASEASCPGFDVCFAECAGALGPFFVTGVP
jgi:hypothetical protein